MSFDFDKYYKQFNDILNNAKEINQLDKCKRLIKQMEIEEGKNDDSNIKNNLKIKINECKYKLNDKIHEIKIDQNTSKNDITMNESSLNTFIMSENNTLSALNNKNKLNLIKQFNKNTNQPIDRKVNIEISNNPEENNMNNQNRNLYIIIIFLLIVILICLVLLILK